MLAPNVAGQLVVAMARRPVHADHLAGERSAEGGQEDLRAVAEADAGDLVLGEVGRDGGRHVGLHDGDRLAPGDRQARRDGDLDQAAALGRAQVAAVALRLQRLEEGAGLRLARLGLVAPELGDVEIDDELSAVEQAHVGQAIDAELARRVLLRLAQLLAQRRDLPVAIDEDRAGHDLDLAQVGQRLRPWQRGLHGDEVRDLAILEAAVAGPAPLVLVPCPAERIAHDAPFRGRAARILVPQRDRAAERLERLEPALALGRDVLLDPPPLGVPQELVVPDALLVDADPGAGPLGGVDRRLQARLRAGDGFVEARIVQPRDQPARRHPVAVRAVDGSDGAVVVGAHDLNGARDDGGANLQPHEMGVEQDAQIGEGGKADEKVERRHQVGPERASPACGGRIRRDVDGLVRGVEADERVARGDRSAAHVVVHEAPDEVAAAPVEVDELQPDHAQAGRVLARLVDGGADGHVDAEALVVEMQGEMDEAAIERRQGVLGQDEAEMGPFAGAHAGAPGHRHVEGGIDAVGPAAVGPVTHNTQRHAGSLYSPAAAILSDQG